MSTVALGFVSHTGWAAMVALREPVAEPAVVDRRRLELVDDDTPANLFHVAREEHPDDGPAFVARTVDAVNARSTRAVRVVLDHFADTHDVVGAGVVLGGTVGDIPVERVIASHQLNHKAEGELFRETIVAACASNDLPALGVPGDELEASAVEALGITGDHLMPRLTELGGTIGPPWRKDHKHAALAAWLALAAHAR